MHPLKRIFRSQYPKMITRLNAMSVLLAVFFLAACSTPEKAWKSAQTKNTRESYRHFLEKYPGHALAAEAKMRIEEMDWKSSQAKNTRESYRHFLDIYPGHAMAVEAKARIEEMDWKSACKAGTVDGFRDFLKTYPKPDVSRLAAMPAEIAPGLALQRMDIRYLNAYDGKTPVEFGWTNWFSGGSFSMHMGYFKRKGNKKTSDTGYLEVTLFLRGTDKNSVPWTIHGNEGIGIDVSLIPLEGEAQSPLGFLIPDLGIDEGGLVTGWKGNLGIELGEKEETWIVLMFAAPSREQLAILKIKNFAIFIEPKPSRS